MKRSEFIKKLLAMPGEDPQVLFTVDSEEYSIYRMIPDYTVTADANGNPVQVPDFIDIQLNP